MPLNKETEIKTKSYGSFMHLNLFLLHNFSHIYYEYYKCSYQNQDSEILVNSFNEWNDEDPLYLAGDKRSIILKGPGPALLSLEKRYRMR